MWGQEHGLWEHKLSIRSEIPWSWKHTLNIFWKLFDYVPLVSEWREKKQKRRVETDSSNPKCWASEWIQDADPFSSHPPRLKRGVLAAVPQWPPSRAKDTSLHTTGSCWCHHGRCWAAVAVSTSVTKSPVALDKLCSLCGPHLQKRHLDRPPAFFPALISFDSKKALSLVSCKDPICLLIWGQVFFIFA